jgi:hypothetical protein
MDDLLRLTVELHLDNRLTGNYHSVISEQGQTTGDDQEIEGQLTPPPHLDSTDAVKKAVETTYRFDGGSGAAKGVTESIGLGTRRRWNNPT